MAVNNAPLVPYGINIPGGAPQNFLGVAMFLTQFSLAVNRWISLAANAINNQVVNAIFSVIGGTGIEVSQAADAVTVALATTGVTAGSYINATLTVNAEGQITSATSGGTPLSGTITVTASGDATGSGNGTGASPTITVPLTLNTVNSNVGTFQGLTITGEGRVTAATNQSYLTANQTITLSGDTTGSGSTAITTNTGKVNGNTFPANAGYTSGGVLYASSTSAVGSSALLTANAIVVGGGAGTAPSVASDWTVPSASILRGSFNANSGITSNLAGIQLLGVDTSIVGMQVDSFGQQGIFFVRRADGTNASKTGLVNADIIGQYGARGYNGSAYTAAATAEITFTATETWSGTANGTEINFVTTPSGGTSTLTALTLLSGGVMNGATGGDEGAGTLNISSGYFINGANIQKAKAATNSLVASPSAVTATSPTYKMLGLAGTITPKFNTAIFLSITGLVSDAILADVITLQLSYGTSTAPSNGTALAGTQVGSIYAITQAVATDVTGFNLSAVITGLSAGTAYWLDLALGSSGGHAITCTSVNVAAHEI
jgi:hypothetical protein